MTHGNAASASLDQCSLRAGLNFDAAAAGLSNQFPVCLMDLNRATARVQSQFAAYGSDLNRATTGFRGRTSADIVEMHASTAALRLDAAGQTSCIHVAAVSLEFHQRHITRNHDRELAREMPGMPSSLPISDDPCGITLYVCGYFVLFELPACFLLRRSAVTSMKNVIDALLLSTTYHHRAHVYLDS